MTLTITPAQFRDLVAPVLPFASRDDMLPVVNAVQIRTEGKWLIATATDRFRVSIQRIEKFASNDDPTTTWPEFEALIPLRAVKSMLTTFKPARASAPFHEMRMTVTDDRLTVVAAGAFDLFDNAEMEWRLESGEFPPTAKLFREAIDTRNEDRSPVHGFNPAFLKDFPATKHGGALEIKFGAPGRAALIADHDGFISILMPRRLVDGPSEDWSDLLDAKPEPIAESQKSAPKKPAARKKVSA